MSKDLLINLPELEDTVKALEHPSLGLVRLERSFVFL
jgi:hypothetical protein